MNSTQSTQNILAPVIKSVFVRLPVEAAFRLFFEDIMHGLEPDLQDARMFKTRSDGLGHDIIF